MGFRSMDVTRPGMIGIGLRISLFLTGLFLIDAAHALPSFARQTGAACEQCHTMAYGPALTPYGRQFKLNGYTWGKSEAAMPLALMVQGGFTQTQKAQPEPPAEHYRDNDNISVDQVSLFYGGRISDHVGLFSQLTYSGPDQTLSWDNIDLRYARNIALGSHYAVLGLSVNNNPTDQDLWNTTAAWTFPYISSALAPAPAAAPFIAGMGGASLGASGYLMIDGALYLEAGGYHGLSDRWLTNLGTGADANLHLRGVAPYLRVGLDKEMGANHLHVGALWLDAKVLPDPMQAKADRYKDVGLDGMYQYFNGGSQSLTVNAMVVHETRSLEATYADGGADSPKGHLTTTSVDATYAYNSTYSASVGLFAIGGNADSTYYPADPFSGSANGRPDSRGFTLQAAYIPFGKSASIGRNWLNLQVGVQYTAYSKFNGGSDNYDGNGRNASDNNTLFLFAWFIL